MDKRLEKRHKRQVARARAHIKLSEPDVRTPEQVAAAKEASRAATAGHQGMGAQYSHASNRNRAASTVHSAAKADA
jgi:hypothetical protein